MVKVLQIGRENFFTSLFTHTPIDFTVVKQYESTESFLNFYQSVEYDLLIANAEGNGLALLQSLRPFSDQRMMMLHEANEEVTVLWFYNNIEIHIKMKTLQDVSQLMEAFCFYTSLRNDPGKKLFNQYQPLKQRSRLLVKKGNEFLTLRLCEIVYFFSENRVIYAVNSLGSKYMTEYTTLDDLKKELNEETFFKVNRKNIINLEHVLRFKKVSKRKYLLHLTTASQEPLYVSPLNMPEFRDKIRSV
jgi:DNA-binding LytR/AlgR family response regulator